MCFYNEADWSAEICDVETWPMGLPTHCDECGAAIGYGEWRKTVFQQESESCIECGGYATPDDDDDPEERIECEHDFGNTFHYACCLSCEKILRAIEDVEIREGCPPHARQPHLTGLYEALTEHESGDEYMRRAVEMFPEIANHAFLVSAS